MYHSFQLRKLSQNFCKCRACTFNPLTSSAYDDAIRAFTTFLLDFSFLHSVVSSSKFSSYTGLTKDIRSTTTKTVVQETWTLGRSGILITSVGCLPLLFRRLCSCRILQIETTLVIIACTYIPDRSCHRHHVSMTFACCYTCACIAVHAFIDKSLQLYVTHRTTKNKELTNNLIHTLILGPRLCN